MPTTGEFFYSAQQNAPSNQPYVVPFTNEYRQQLVANGLPSYAEMTRQGVRWKVRTATLFAPIAAMPSTLANLEIVNNSASLNFVVDTIYSSLVVGAATTYAHDVWAGVGPKVYSGNTALVIYSANGTASYTSAAGVALSTAITQTVVEPGWEVFPGRTTNFAISSAIMGGTVVGDVNGRLVVPPGRSLYLAVTGSVATASSTQVGASGYFVAITNSV